MKMLHRRCLVNYKVFIRNFSSALYVTGDKAHSNFSVLTPVIDFESQDKHSLAKNIKDRRLNIDIEKIQERWQYFQSVHEKRAILEETRSVIGQSISKLLKNPEENYQEIEKLKLHAKVIKDDLKNLKLYYYSIEGDTMLQILNLPNVIHSRTPTENDYVLYEYLEPSEKSDSHMKLGIKNKLLKYINPMSCYLKSEAALFEAAIQNYFYKTLQNLSFTHLSNADFVKSVVVEGCGDVFQNIFSVEDPSAKTSEINRLHLSGAASLHSFMAYFTKHTVPEASFTLAYFSQGRSYQMVNAKLNNLFNLNQETVTSIFLASLDDPDVDYLVKQLTDLYKPLGYHFKIALLAAYNMQKSESLRISVQMFSNHLQEYVEVGYLSYFDNYLSKRLLFNTSINKERVYPKVIFGKILNVQKLLGCVLENNSVKYEPLLSDLLRNNLCT